MTVSPPFYVIQRTPGHQFFDCGHWTKRIDRVRHYKTPERALVDCEEWEIASTVIEEISIVPYRVSKGHNGQTVILPA